MARCTLIEDTTSVRIILRHMRRYLHVAQLCDELACVVTLIGPERDTMRAR
jgi:hypothetical protein